MRQATAVAPRRQVLHAGASAPCPAVQTTPPPDGSGPGSSIFPIPPQMRSMGRLTPTQCRDGGNTSRYDAFCVNFAWFARVNDSLPLPYTSPRQAWTFPLTPCAREERCLDASFGQGSPIVTEERAPHHELLGTIRSGRRPPRTPLRLNWRKRLASEEGGPPLPLECARHPHASGWCLFYQRCTRLLTVPSVESTVRMDGREGEVRPADGRRRGRAQDVTQGVRHRQRATGQRAGLSGRR